MRYWIAALSIATLLFSGDAALADKRVAFVVGNGAYKNVPQLPNPTMDARTMASTLRNVGFDVVEGYNLTRDKMTEKLLEFGHKAEGADIAVFYYAGHGIAMGGTNYLLPVDADLKSEADVKLGATINVDTTLDQTMQDAKVKLVFLDACRDNPFAARMQSAKLSRGLTVDSGLAAMNTGQGTLIAFATSPGQTALDGDKGTNSPFTRALVANITQPGVEIQQAMTKVRAQVNDETNKNQMPWGHTDLTGSVYLNPASLPADAKVDSARENNKADAPATTAAAPASDMELEFWRSVKDSRKVEELNAYVTNYPNGAFKPLALTRIAKLQGGDTSPDATRNLTVDTSSLSDEADQVAEDQIRLDRGNRRDVQRRLTKLGFDVHVNGKFDDETRNVIKRWQAARGYPSTGFLNRAQHTALISENLASRAPEEGDSATSSSSSDEDRSSSGSRHHYSSGGGRHYSRGGGGPGAFFGGMMGGLFRR
jgi:uncharacterized caspase-like protein